MKPFNLEEAKAGKPLVTRDGRQVKFVGFVPEAASPLVVMVEGNQYVSCLQKNGLYHNSHEHASWDVFMSQVKKGGWVNIYKGNGKYNTGNVFDTEEEAKKGLICLTYLVATVRIEWEE